MIARRFLAPVRFLTSKNTIKRVVLTGVRKNNDVVYGAQASNRRVPSPLQTPTEDYDIYTNKNIKVRANQLQGRLDNKFKGNFFYSKPAIHPGTQKVMFVGNDMRKGTEDDKGIADFSKMPRGIKHNKINGLNVSTRQQLIRDRIRAIKNPEAKFRRDKDKKALLSLRIANRLKRKGII